jgi:hypothetical protein
LIFLIYRKYGQYNIVFKSKWYGKFWWSTT